MIAVNAGNAANRAGFRTSDAASGDAFRAAFTDAQQRGASALAGGVKGAAPVASAAEREFMDYASMSLQEKMFYAALASLGISKAEYDAMSAADKLKVAEKVSLVLQQLAKAEQARQVEHAG
ncbi:hypothetical protein ACOTCW_04550 [Achromobacter xylosoxidans]